MTVELNELNMTITVSSDTRDSENGSAAASRSPARRLAGPQANANPHADEDMIKLTLSSLAAGAWMQNAEMPLSETVSANELTSLSALIAYVAMQSGENEFRVERRLADRFNVPSVKRLPADAFDNAIRYLVDGI
jgi:hypothetical protein